LILKFTGKPNQHSYELFYAKINELTEPSASFQPVTIYDLNKDGKKDILLPMDKYVDPNTIVFSYLLVQNPVSSVNEDNVNAPNQYELYQNYPNPFNPTTKIQYSIPKDGVSEKQEVKLVIYDLLGSEVVTLVNEEKSAGNYEVEFNASNLPSGMYIYKIQTNNFSDTKKMILLK
jgi:hypothetical protein